ncbi:hypothetical protein [Gracilimonas sp.]|uniref:hypothetical protein n=1 Tax=Gracilimonas sp. TaxID=1974203 RepID=UPI0028712542|nr:hypothetical protein [Gracilimonas sp.]
MANFEHQINLTAKFVDNGILVEWNPFNAEESDLYFYAEEIHDEWEHSVMKYIDLHEQPLDTQSGERLLGTVNKDREKYTWHFKLVADEREEVISIKKDDSSDDEGGDQDENIKPISTDPNDWEVQGKVLDGKKIVAGVVDIGGVAHMLVQSQRKIDGVWTNCGELYTSTDLKEWTPHENNPVLIDAMPWAGQDNGIPHRIAPRTLIKWQGSYYTYTRDRNGQYPGIRGVGVFSSDDLIDWQGYDDWFVDVERVKAKVPDNLLADNEYERCYLKCATIGAGIYIIVNIEDVEGNDSTFVFKGTDPIDFNSFEYIEAPWVGGGRIVGNLYRINGEWIQIDRGTPGYDSIRIQKGWKPFELGDGIPIDHDGPRETAFPFFYQGRWHLFYDDNKDGRNIHLATQNTP